MKNNSLFRQVSIFAVVFLSIFFMEGCASHQSSFAVIVDNETYKNVREEIDAYKNILDNEGLNTFVIAKNWENPDQVKDEILKLSRENALEGVVFVGEIPIVMVRGGQHLTSAFKMHEKKFPMNDSSVPSDRFYDDFDFDFEFISKDTLDSNRFYYRLTSKGTQSIESDIYSARILVPEGIKGDKYQMYRDYFTKIVAAHQEDNTFDKFIFFAGHGYNSDCMTIWRQKPIIYRDYFAEAFEKSSGNRFYNFRQDNYMKFKLFSEIQRTDIDLFQFNEHGAFNTQYINGGAMPESLGESLDLLKQSFRSLYRSRYQGSKYEKDFIEEAANSYYMDRSMFSDANIRKTAEQDRESYRNTNIYLDDIAKLKTGARVVILNACYNGSFHRKDGYVAGYHLFNGGRCVAVQGNTVNVLQDKWEDQLIGYFPMGIRIGLWQKEFSYLESHLLGDPTFRFSSSRDKALTQKIYANLVDNRSHTSFWKSLLKKEDPMLRAVGIKRLSGKLSSSKLLKIFKTDDAPVVRQQALLALQSFADANSVEAVKYGLNDVFEVIRVRSCSMAADLGDNSLIPYLVKAYSQHPEAIRVSFAASSALCVFPTDLVIKAIKDAGEDTSSFERKLKGVDNDIKTIINKELSFAKRESAIRGLRNNHYHYATESLLKVLEDNSESTELRVVLAEALGWYEMSVEKSKIINSFNSILSQEGIDSALVEQLTKSLKRLK